MQHRIPDPGEAMRIVDRVLEMSSVCDLSRDPDLLREMGRVTVARPVVVVCRRSYDADLLREHADRVVTCDEFFSDERLCELYSMSKKRNKRTTVLPET